LIFVKLSIINQTKINGRNIHTIKTITPNTTVKASIARKIEIKINLMMNPMILEKTLETIESNIILISKPLLVGTAESIIFHGAKRDLIVCLIEKKNIQ
jgi:hypothetical protein